MTQDCQRPVIDRLITAARIAAVLLCLPFAVSAQDVTVTTTGDGLTLTGRVVGYDGTYLQLDTSYGLMTLDYDGVTCVGADCPDPSNFVPVVRLSGASRMGEVMMPALIEAFGRSVGLMAETATEDEEHLLVQLQDDAGVVAATFALRLTNTDEGFADLIAFETDVVMALREVRPQEAARAAQIGLGDITNPRQARILGFDALVPVVTPGLGLRNVALRDVARAFRGLVTNWAEIGGPDLPIALHLGPVSGGPWQFFVDHVVALDGGSLGNGIIRHDSAAATARAVATTPGSLGMLPYGETANSQPLALRDACGFTAIPQNLTLKTQDYPLTEPLFLYLPDRRQPALIGEFLAWLRGPEAQLVVRRAGFVDQGAVPIPLDAQGQRFANAIAAAGGDITLAELQRMVQVLTPRTHLSTSFRFETGTGQLDAPSRSNLLALGQAIRDGRYDGQSLMLVGFGNGTPDLETDIAGSRDRAEAVRSSLIAALGGLPDEVIVEVAAFGEALPMGCDDTEWGRQRNRRVELWVDQG